MARANVSASATERNFPIVRVSANLSARTLRGPWQMVKCSFDLYSDDSRSTRMAESSPRTFAATLNPEDFPWIVCF